MALKRADSLPGEFVETPDYPGGKAFNTSHSVEGTSFLAAWQNDEYGLYDAILAGAETLRSGVPDTVNASDYYDALQTLSKGKSSPKWRANVKYVHPVIAFGSNDKLYISLRNSVGKDPTSSPSDWSVIISGARRQTDKDTKWNSSTRYRHPALVFGSDDRLYQSLRSSQGQDPVTKRMYWADLENLISASTMLFDNTTTYDHPSIVFGTDDKLYISKRESVGQTPATSPSFWTPLYMANTWIGNNYKVYQHPSTVFADNNAWVSKQSSTNKEPANSPQFWLSLSSMLATQSSVWVNDKNYVHPDFVIGSDDYLYISSRDNVGKDPTSQPGYWTLFAGGDNQRKIIRANRNIAALIHVPGKKKDAFRKNWMRADEGFYDLTEHFSMIKPDTDSRIQYGPVDKTYILETGEYVITMDIPLRGVFAKIQNISAEKTYNWKYAYAAVTWGDGDDEKIMGSYVGCIPPDTIMAASTETEADDGKMMPKLDFWQKYFVPPACSTSSLIAPIKTLKQIRFKIGVLWGKNDYYKAVLPWNGGPPPGANSALNYSYGFNIFICK